jgi:putative membrane protein
MKPFLSTALKGFAMGTANVVPGVSGGTIALITGIYSRLVACISAFATPSIWKELFRGNFKSWWQKVDGAFLAALFVGLAVSILTFAKVVTWSLVEYPVVTWAFFFGLIIVSTAYMLYDIKAWKIKDFLFILIGFGLGLAFCFLTPTQTPQTGWFYFVSGAIAICTMILPGVSGSFLLQIFGNYDIVMASLDVTDINWSVLLPFAFGCLVGIIAFSKFLKWLLARYERPTMILLIGFVIGTLLKVWPWADAEAVQQAGHGLQILPAIVAMLLGGALVTLIQKLSKKA